MFLYPCFHQGNVTLLFYNTTKHSMKEKENHDVSFPIDTKSDVSIVRQPDIKLIIGTSWKKFARIGTFGKEVFQSNSSNTTDCNKNVSMSSLAAIGNILYLKGKCSFNILFWKFLGAR